MLFLTNQFGPDGDVKFERVSDRKLRVSADELHITGAIQAKQIYLNGVSLVDYFEKYTDERIADAMKKIQHLIKLQETNDNNWRNRKQR